MQQKNVIVFIILAALILAGWPILMNRFFPPKPAEEEKAATGPVAWTRLSPAQKARAEVASLVAGVASGPAALTTIGRMEMVLREDRGLYNLAVLQLPPRLRPAELEQFGIALAALTPDPLLPAVVAAAQAPPEAPQAPEVVQLGDAAKGFYLTAKLTTRGGGVESVTLTKFEAASREGLPVYDDLPDGQKVKAPLQLVQEDPFQPSFLLYSYDPVNKEVDPQKLVPSVLLGEALWKFEGKTEKDGVQIVRFSAPVPGYDDLTVTRVYSLGPNDYHIGLTIEVNDKRSGRSADLRPRPFRYQLAGAHGLPIEGEWYTYTYRNAVIGQLDSNGGLVRTVEEARQVSHAEGGSAVPLGPRGGTSVQYAGVENQFFASVVAVDNDQVPLSDGGVPASSIVAWARPTLESSEVRVRVIGINLGKGELSVVPIGPGRIVRPTTVHLVPRALADVVSMNLQEGDDIFINVYETDGRLTVGTYLRRGTTPKPFLDDVTVRLVSESFDLKPGETVAHRYLLYQGPVKVRLLAYGERDRPAVDYDLVTRYADTLHLRTLTDYRSAGPVGWFAQKMMVTDLLITCTNVMHWLLYWLRQVVINDGLAIIVLTVIVRGLMFPISRKQAQMSAKMAELGPEMKKVQEKYKNDPQRKTEAVMELYRKHNVNPVGGCLPLLLQMPIFLGLYYALQESISFRLAPFLWIQNLAAPDMLIYWGEQIPWISNPDAQGGFLYLGPYFNLLPVVAVALMIVQQKMLMPPPTDEQQEVQQKMMKYMMVFFGLMFYKVAAGLCLYFIASSVWGLAERKLLPKKKPVVGEQQPPPQPPRGGGGGGGPGNGPQQGGGKGGNRRNRNRRQPQQAPAEDTRFQKMKDWWNEILKQARKK